MHEHADPSKYASQLLNRRLRACGARGANAEVFHSLRGDAISVMRDAEVQGRDARLQAGHELADVHDLYGYRTLSAEACRHLATLPLNDQIDWGVFRGVDFDALAAGRRSRGRRGRRG